MSRWIEIWGTLEAPTKIYDHGNHDPRTSIGCAPETLFVACTDYDQLRADRDELWRFNQELDKALSKSDKENDQLRAENERLERAYASETGKLQAENERLNQRVMAMHDRSIEADGLRAALESWEALRKEFGSSTMSDLFGHSETWSKCRELTDAALTKKDGK